MNAFRASRFGSWPAVLACLLIIISARAAEVTNQVL
jgi:hypothetical protein